MFRELSATVVGINDVRTVFEEAKTALALTGRCAELVRIFERQTPTFTHQANHFIP
jgi:hypothetical protein